MARTELEKLMALLKTDASVDPKPVRTGVRSVRNKSAKKLSVPAKGPNGEDFDTDDGFFDENGIYHTYDAGNNAELLDDNNDDSDDDATPLEYPDVLPDPPTRQRRPSSAPESRNTQPHTTGRRNRNARPHTTMPRNGNARPQTNGPRNGNAHRSGRRNEHKTFDPKRQYVPDMKSKIMDFNGREIVAPEHKIILDADGIIDFGAAQNKKYLNEDRSIKFQEFNKTDLVRLLRRQIAMYLHDKKSTEKNIYKQNQLVRRYETRLKYVERHSPERQ
jgi:hypothetical protein